MVCLLAGLLLQTSRLNVRWIDDEPQAVLAILESPNPTEALWLALFQSEGYRRLKDREAGMKRAFTDDEFRKFVLSDDLRSKAGELRRTVNDWRKIDFDAAGKSAMAYLPSQATLHAKVYPLIKPRSNSFVWDTEKDPAIMLYVDPNKNRELLRKTVVHELHHIGYSSCCPSPEFTSWTKGLSEGQRKAWMWAGAFGEGFAVLAAAGNLKADPMDGFAQDVKDAWNHGMTHLDSDMKDVGTFLSDTASGKLSGDAVNSKGSTFFDVQGPWYTVGYVQATTIQKAYGHKKLMECYLDPRMLMLTYNRAVAERHWNLPTWPTSVVAELGIKAP